MEGGTFSVKFMAVDDQIAILGNGNQGASFFLARRRPPFLGGK